MVFDGSKVSFFIAFLAGLVTFFASCLLPLVPTYLAYLSGISLSSKKGVFKHGLLFTIGFIIVFVLLGATANTIGQTLSLNRLLIQKIGGIVFIFLGTLLTGKVLPAIFYREVHISPTVIRWHKLNSLVVGFTFGFAWTPCIGPVLAVILFWASQAATLAKGVLLLFFYGMGLGIPFLIIALGFEKLAPKLKKATKFGRYVQLLAGIIIIATGILMLLGRVDVISIYLIRLVGLSEQAL